VGRWSLIGFFLFCFSLTAEAQFIRGLIKDETAKPIAGVSVKAILRNGEKLIAFNTSDANGQYQLRIVQKDIAGLEISLSHTGYQPTSLSIAHFPKKDSVIHFTLVTNQRQLDTISVKEKRKKIDTTSFSADSLKRLYHQNIQQLLQEIPGLVLIEGKFIYKGKVVSKVLFEGDNLTSEGYQHLLKSLSTHSLDSIQLIENYVDKTELGNSFKKYGEEVVINFKFKGKKKVRNFGRITLSSGFPDGIFEASADNLSLIHSLKMVNIANFNSKGLVTEYLFDKTGFNLSPHLPGLFSHLAKVNSPVALIAPYTISPEYIGIERIYSNRSGFLTSDIFNRINQKMFFKANIRGIYDKLPQQMEVSTLFLDSGFIPTKTIDQSNTRNASGAFEGSLNWLASPKIQLVSALGLSYQPTTTSSQNSINYEAFSQHYNNKIRTVNVRQNLIWLYNPKSIFKAEIYLGANALTEAANSISNVYQHVLENNQAASVTQDIQATNRYAGAGVNANIRLSNRISSVFNLALLSKKSRFNSGLQIFKPDNQHLQSPNDFQNELYEKRTDLIFENEMVLTGKLFRNAYSIKLANQFNYLVFNIEDKRSELETSLANRLHWSPRVGFNYELPSQTSLGIEVFLSRVFPTSNTIYNGLVLYDQIRFRSGFDTLRVLANPGMALSLRKQAGIKFFSLSYSLSKSPVQQSQTFDNRNLFIYTRPLYLENPAISHGLHLSFLIHFSKTSISLNSYQSLGKSIFIVNQKELKSSYIFSTQSLKIASQFGKHISTNLETSVNIFSNKQENESISSRRNRNSTISNSQETNVTFLDQMTASVSQKLIIMDGSESKQEHYYFLDSKISRTSKSNRLTTYIECRNILNRSSYSTIQQDLFVQVQTYATILPRMLLLGVEIKL